MQPSKLSATDIESLHDQVIDFFEDKWTEAEENERFKKGKHWSSADEQTIKDQNRQPYSMAAMATKINTILATQRQARTQFDVKAKVDPNDEVKAEFAKLALRDSERASKFKYIESEVFDSGVSVKYGGAEAYVDYSKLEPRIKFKKLDYKDVVWDKNSKLYDMEDALWMAKVDRLYRFQLAEEYPDKYDQLAETNDEIGREKESYYVSKNPNGQLDYDIISKFTHYQKVIRKYYYVVHPDTEGILGLDNQIYDKYLDKKEAERKLRELNLPYILNGLDIEGSIEEKDEVAYDKYVFADSQILEYEQTNYPCFPVKVFRCFHFEDDFWSFMDMLKSPQIFMDRLFSQIDYTFGTDIKNVYQLNIQALAEGETPETAMRKAEKTGGVIKTKTNETAIQSIPSKGINPQWIQVATIMQQFVEDFAGGRSFQGLSEGAGESGKAINLKQRQGAMIAALMMDNLSRFKQSLGEFALWLIQEYDTVERQIKVQGGEITPEMLELLNKNQIYTPSQVNPDEGYVTLNKGIPMLKDAELELVVTEVGLTETEKEYKYYSLIEAGRNFPLLQQSPTYLMKLLEYDPNMKESDRRMIINEIKGQMQAESQASQEERNIKKASILQDASTAEMQAKLQLIRGQDGQRASQ